MSSLCHERTGLLGDLPSEPVAARQRIPPEMIFLFLAVFVFIEELSHVQHASGATRCDRGGFFLKDTINIGNCKILFVQIRSCLNVIRLDGRIQIGRELLKRRQVLNSIQWK